MEEMLAGLTMSEYIHWQAIYETEPFPEDRADLRTAELLRMILITGHANQIPKITDLIPDWWGDRQPAQQTPEQMQATMQLIKTATAATKKKKKPKK